MASKIDSASSLQNARMDANGFWADSRFQYQFSSPGGTKIKFRFGAEISKDYLGCYIKTINVMEYYKVRTFGSDEWLQAGEWAHKQIFDLSIRFKRHSIYNGKEYHVGPTDPYTGLRTPITNGDGFNKNSTEWAMAVDTEHLDEVEISGDYSAKVTQPGWPQTYHRNTNVYWFLNEFHR